MAPGWSQKDERKYEVIKQSSLERGHSLERAKEVAARTVNRDRRRSGRTPNKTTQGTGNPNLPLEDRTVRELRNRARQLEIAGRTAMSKADLVRAIRERQ